MKKYRTFAEWLIDFNFLRKHPEDVDFLKAVETRYRNSPPELQVQMSDHVLDTLALQRPLVAFQNVMKSQSKATLIIKSEEDPWFEC